MDCAIKIFVFVLIYIACAEFKLNLDRDLNWSQWESLLVHSPAQSVLPPGYPEK
jgi:hypothetical protein